MPRIDFRAAIFDLDGTLLDSMGLWETFCIAFLEKRGLALSAEYVRKIRSMSFQEAAKFTIWLFQMKDSVDDILAEWNDMAIYAYEHDIFLKPFAKEYLIRLKSCGIPLAVATSLPRVLYEPGLKHNGIYQLFDVFCSVEEVGKGKDFPDIYLQAANRLSMPCGECIVFEDTLQGVRSAKNAGMKVYGVYDQYSEAFKEEIKAVADAYLFDLSQGPFPSI